MRMHNETATTGVAARWPSRFGTRSTLRGLPLPFLVRGYWESSAWVVIAMMAVVAVRVHELFPVLAAIRPALLAGVGGMTVLLMHSSEAVVYQATREPLVRLVTAYYLWTVLTFPFALWSGRAMNAYQVFIPLLLLVLAFAMSAPTRARLWQLQMGLVGACAFLSARLAVSGITIADNRLTSGGGYDPNDLASLMAFTMPLAAGIALRERGAKRLAAVVALPLLALIIAKTGSRGGAVALVMGMGVFILGQRSGRMRVTLTVLAMIGAIGLWSFGPPVFRARLLSMTELETDYNFSAYTGRKAVWERARGYIREHPLTGVGYENFPIAEGKTWEKIGEVGKWSAAHNAYLQAFAELGLIGGCLFLALLISAGRRAYALWRRSERRIALGIPDRPEMLAALMAFCTSAYFLSHAYSWALFALLGLIFLADRVTQADFATAGCLPDGVAPRRHLRGQE